MSAMTEQEFLHDLAEHVYCRLQPSSVQGIGVFAIRAIPAGTKLFQGCKPTPWLYLSRDALAADVRIPEPVKQFIHDLFFEEGGAIQVPAHSMNDVNISYFMNHAVSANVTTVEKTAGELQFVAARDIAAGEECLLNYDEYAAQ